MRTFVISDIHGNNNLFRKSLKYVGLKKSDQLILLGDLIDRGADSKGVLDTVFLLLENGFKVKCLMGNHERMLLDAIDNPFHLNRWISNGGDKTLYSFLTSEIDRIPKKYVDFISSFDYFHENENSVLVHASLNMKIQNPFEDLETILWERDQFKYFDSNWLKNRTLIHGHSPQKEENISKSIFNKDKIIGIDNGSFIQKSGFGSICILLLEELQVTFIK